MPLLDQTLPLTELGHPCVCLPHSRASQQVIDEIVQGQKGPTSLTKSKPWPRPQPMLFLLHPRAFWSPREDISLVQSISTWITSIQCSGDSKSWGIIITLQKHKLRFTRLSDISEGIGIISNRADMRSLTLLLFFSYFPAKTSGSRWRKL